MKRIEILKEAEKLLKRYKQGGICLAIKEVLVRNKIFDKGAKDIFPLLDIKYAEKYRRDPLYGNDWFWWNPYNFTLFSGRRRFFRWLVKQYKNDKEEIQPNE